MLQERRVALKSDNMSSFQIANIAQIFDKELNFCLKGMVTACTPSYGFVC